MKSSIWEIVTSIYLPFQMPINRENVIIQYWSGKVTKYVAAFRIPIPVRKYFHLILFLANIRKPPFLDIIGHCRLYHLPRSWNHDRYTTLIRFSEEPHSRFVPIVKR